MAVVVRLVQIIRVIVSHLAAQAWCSLCQRVPFLHERFGQDDYGPPQRLKEGLEELGGAFVKLGQMLALQPDILPKEYCEAMYNLLDKVNPVSVEEIEQVFQQEVGRCPGDILDSFDRKPIASGSIGQVHIGYLGGRKVAVKVQRPDTQSGFRRDIRMMSVFAWTIRVLHFRPLFWLIDPLQEFADWTIDELDFRREARYMRELRRHAETCPRQYVPEVVKYATKRVLLIEFLEGVTLIDHMRLVSQGDEQHKAWLKQVGFDSHQFAQNLIDVFVRGANEGIFHADLHPANLMVLGRPNNVVGYIDCGITGVLSPFSRQNLLATTLAFARGDIDGLCTAFFNVSALNEKSNPEGFRADMKVMSKDWYSSGDDDDSQLSSSASTVFMEMLTLSRKHQIWPQRDIIRYIRSAMGIDSLIRTFDPEFDVGGFLASSSKKYLAKQARKALFSHDAFITWTKATTDLSRSGAFRFSAFLEHFVNAKAAQQPSPRADPMQDALLFALACLIGVTAFVTNESYDIGLNLFTSQMIVATAFVATWWKNIHQGVGTK